MFDFLQFLQDVQAKLKQPLRERNGCRSFLCSVFSLREILKVVAPVEDEEELLVLSRAKDIRTKSRPSSYHLHKLDIRFNWFEKYQVQNRRDVDACVEHIHGYSNLEVGIGFELANKVICIIHIIVYKTAKVCPFPGIQLMKPLHDKFSVLMIIGKNDSLTEFFPVINLESFIHQCFEDSVTGAFIINSTENFIIPDFRISHICAEHFFVLFFFFGGQVFIFNPSFKDRRRPFQRFAPVDKVLILDGLFQTIRKSRDTAFTTEYPISIGIDLVTRCCRQSDQQTIEIRENRGILFKDGSVRLINNNKVKPSCRKPLRVAVDVVYHRLICAEHQPRIHILLPCRRKFTHAHVREKFHEVAFCLVYERCPVRKEKDVLHPLVAGKDIHQRNSDAGLSCSCRHDK